MRRLQTSTLSNQNISSYLLTDTYTADADRAVMVALHLDQVAGNGDYLAYVTVQKGGAGSAYMFGNITTISVPSGTTAIGWPSIILPLESGDVAKCYVKGLAGDTTTPDILTRWFELTYLRPTTAGRTLDVSATGEAGLDFDNIKDATGAHTLTNITVPVVTAVTGLTAANVADAVWDEAISGHLIAGTTGEALNNADASGVTVNASVAVSEAVAEAVASGELAIQTYVTMAQTVTSTITDNLSAATKLWLAIKLRAADADTDSMVFIEKIAGLTRVNKASYTTVAHGALTVSGSSGAWEVLIDIDEVATGLLAEHDGTTCKAEVKALISGDTVIVWSGQCIITAGVVQAIT